MLTRQDYVAKPAECECPEIPDSLLSDLGMYGPDPLSAQAATDWALRSHVFSTLPQRLACAFSNEGSRSLRWKLSQIRYCVCRSLKSSTGFSPPLIALSTSRRFADCIDSAWIGRADTAHRDNENSKPARHSAVVWLAGYPKSCARLGIADNVPAIAFVFALNSRRGGETSGFMLFARHCRRSHMESSSV